MVLITSEEKAALEREFQNKIIPKGIADETWWLYYKLETSAKRLSAITDFSWVIFQPLDGIKEKGKDYIYKNYLDHPPIHLDRLQGATALLQLAIEKADQEERELTEEEKDEVEAAFLKASEGYEKDIKTKEYIRIDKIGLAKDDAGNLKGIEIREEKRERRARELYEEVEEIRKCWQSLLIPVFRKRVALMPQWHEKFETQKREKEGALIKRKEMAENREKIGNILPGIFSKIKHKLQK